MHQTLQDQPGSEGLDLKTDKKVNVSVTTLKSITCFVSIGSCVASGQTLEAVLSQSQRKVCLRKRGHWGLDLGVNLALTCGSSAMPTHEKCAAETAHVDSLLEVARAAGSLG